jgi:rhamnosyl/mannosyltransferase
MKILQLGKYFEPYQGGIETHLAALCKGLVSERHEVKVLVCNTEPRTAREHVGGVEVTRAGALGRVLSTEICPALIRELSSETYDVLHLHTPNPMGMLAYSLARKPTRHRLVITHHSDVVRQAPVRKLLSPLFSAVMRRANAIVATSPNYASTSLELAPYLERIRVVPYGLDASLFENCTFTSEARQLRARFGDRVVLGVGRLIYYKGFDVLLQAMSHVQGHLVLVGEGPLRSALERRSRSLGIEQRVTFAGGIPQLEMPAYYQAADLFVLPSIARSEAFGIVQLEAMASGLAVVNTRLDSGVPFVSLDGETGLTVAPGDPNELASAIRALLGDPERRLLMGERGRERVKAQFSPARMLSALTALYRAEESRIGEVASAA